MGVDPQEMRE